MPSSLSDQHGYILQEEYYRAAATTESDHLRWGDVKVILERGWGQRHPLAWADWWCWVRFVPSGFVMVYAPRDADELETVLEIIRAAAWWVSGAELQGSGGRMQKECR
ncbi:hypothetical protein EYZ11_001740 [Aspergillus tanneri]|uniref:Luciferase domain-containing protein n=1 Tax=Aspergillus tanneri TaxID=1220188 RepID=A0A4S3JU98_9EURO|nr:hypothetical protein EYZ11_001740 [Aspergillus tanneri]